MDFRTGFPKYADIESDELPPVRLPVPVPGQWNLKFLLQHDKLMFYFAVACAILAVIAIIVAIALAAKN